MQDIKFNCDVSDAQYWGYYSVCGLLMRYRDLFRSEKGLKPWTEIKRDEIGAWIEKKEAQWPELEKLEFRDLTVGGRSFHPFDVAEINAELNKEGLVYGAGYGMYLKPTFFVAELRSVRELSGLTVYTSGTEMVRDLFTSPAMLQERTVFLRIEPLVMLLLYKHSELNSRRVSALEDAFAAYGLPHRQLVDVTFEQRIEEMALQYSEVLLAHELAEAAEEVPEWKELLSLAAGDRQAEHYLRAVKDLLADTSPHGPYRKMIDTRDFGALGLSLALPEGYRRVLFPEMKAAYSELSSRGNWGAVEQARQAGYERFRAERDALVGIFRTARGKDDFAAALREMLRKAGVKK
jgi:uncharacterized protein DUF6866